MNTVILMGRLTADPEYYKATKEHDSLATFSLAVQKDKDNAIFVPCTAFGRYADFADQYLNKGTKIALTGRLDISKYVDKEGNQRTSTKVLINQIEFCESKRKEEQGEEYQKKLEAAEPERKPRRRN